MNNDNANRKAGSEQSPSVPGSTGPAEGSAGADQSLLTSAEFQKALLDAVPLPLFFKDTSGRYQVVNRTFAEALGLTEEEILGKTVFDIAPAELAEKYASMDAALLEQPGLQIYDHRVRDISGALHDVVFHKATFLQQDKVQGIVGVMLDITERKNAESAVALNEKRLRQIIDLVPHFVFAKDCDGRFILANEALARTYGTTVEGLLGKTDADFSAAPDEVHHFQHDDKAVLCSGQPMVIPQETITTATGEQRILQTTKIPFSFSASDRPAVLGVSIDVTERIQAEQIIMESHAKLDARVRERTDELLKANAALAQEVSERNRAEQDLTVFRELVNQSSDAIFVVDFATARILEVNDAACLILDYEKEQLLELSVMDIAVARKDAANWIEHTATLAENKHMILEDWARRKNGTTFPIEVSVKYIEYDGNKYVFAVVRDIGLRKEMESHIQITTDVLRLSSENIPRQHYVETLGMMIKKWCNCSTATIRIGGGGETCSTSIACSSFSGHCPEELHLEHMTQGNCTCFRALRGELYPEGMAVMTPGRSFFSDDTALFLNSLPPGESVHFHHLCLLRKFASVAVIPVSYHNDVLGLIVFADEQRGGISRKTVQVLETLAPTIAEALCRHNVEEELKQSKEQMRNFAAHMQEAREEERTSIAREIHDQLGQILTVLKYDLSWLSKKCQGNEEIDAKAKSMMSLVNQTILTVKKIVTELRPSVLDHLGIAAAIEWQVGEVQKLTGIRCAVELRPEKVILDSGMATQIFRVFQEIMTNVIRHADATEVRVHLENTNEGLLLQVADNGRGISEKQIMSPASYGLLGIRERVHFLGGVVDFSNVHPHGTQVKMFVPAVSGKGAEANRSV